MKYFCNNNLFIYLVVILYSVGCTSKKDNMYSKEEYKKMTDSLYEKEAIRIIKEADENLNYRKKVEMNERIRNIQRNKEKQPPTVDLSQNG